MAGTGEKKPGRRLAAAFLEAVRFLNGDYQLNPIPPVIWWLTKSCRPKLA